MKGYGVSISVLVMVASSVFPQSPMGHFEGAVSRDGSIQLVKADFDTVNGKITGTYDIPELMDFEVPIQECHWAHDTLMLNLNYGNFFCRYFPPTGEITGISEQWRPKLRMHLKKTGRKVELFRREEVTFFDNHIRLAGVLFKPEMTRPCPFVILIHGSGSVDRNAAYYHSLGYVLAAQGIGVLLYDKRGCGKSTGNLDSASLWNLADDAVAGLRFLRARTDLRISKLGFLGTSQGGWVGAIAANRSTGCDFAIFNVGPSVSVFDQDIHRVRYSMMDDGVPPATIDTAVEYTRLYFRYVRSNAKTDWDMLQQYAERIRTRAWVSFVNLPDSKDDLAWWRINNYDPTDDLKKMPCPVLSIFGEKDALVPPSENRARMDSLLHLSRTRYTIVVIPGVGHDELTFQGLNGDEWNWPGVYWQWRKRPEIITNAIVDWIKHL